MLRAAEPTSKDVSIISVNYRMIDHVERLLCSFEAARPTVSHEVILVENGSTDPTKELVSERFPWVRHHTTTNRGLSAGNNRGTELATGRYILFLNPDVVVAPGMIDRWIAWMDAHPDVGISGPTMLFPDGTLQASAFRYHKLLTPFFRRTRLGETAYGKKHLEEYGRHILAQHDDHADVEWLLGAALCIRREAVFALNGWDEQFFLYFEDEDLCRRARVRGHRVVFLHGISMTHVYGRLSHIRAWHDIFRKRAIREHVKSAIKYFWRYRTELF